MDNNKGFTLIELLVSIAIFGIVIAAVFGFMLSGTKSYSNINSRVDLQTNSQLTMNFLEEYLIDCDEAFYNSADSLYIINKATVDYTAYVFQYDSSKKSIFFKQGTAKKNADGSYTCTLESPALLTDLAESFSISRDLSGSGDNIDASSAEIKVTFKNYSSEIKSAKFIAFRNEPSYKPIA